MANFCENCGSPLQGDNKFCPNCGAPVKGDASIPAATNTPPLVPAATAVPLATTVAPETSSAGNSTPIDPSAGAAATATMGALHPEPTPGKPLDMPRPEYNREQEFARGGTGPKYEPDTDLQSMFLRYDNRLNRKRYILRCLALGAAVSIITKATTLIAVSTHINAIAMLGTLISIVSIIPSFMLIIRRLHDLNRPTWWCIGVLIPLVNFVLGIYLLFFKGTDGSNQYGPDPLEVQD